jgi:hypothetical protein
MVAMQRRMRSMPHSFQDRIATEKARCTERLAATPQGPDRDALIKKIRQLDTASQVNDWLQSPGLKSSEFARP